jgi:hypothetical protein
VDDVAPRGALDLVIAVTTIEVVASVASAEFRACFRVFVAAEPVGSVVTEDVIATIKPRISVVSGASRYASTPVLP